MSSMLDWGETRHFVSETRDSANSALKLKFRLWALSGFFLMSHFHGSAQNWPWLLSLAFILHLDLAHYYRDNCIWIVVKSDYYKDVLLLKYPIKLRVLIKMRAAFWVHPPTSYVGRTEQGRELSFWWKSLNLIWHCCLSHMLSQFHDTGGTDKI